MGRANKPRDLGQELTDLKAQVRALMTGALTRPAMRVEQGNFPVTGGGSILVKDGGGITLTGGGAFKLFGTDYYVQIVDGSFSIGTTANGQYVRPSMILTPTGFLAAKSDTEYAAFQVDIATGAAVVTSSINRIMLPYTPTGVAANVRMLFDGTIQMVTSSLRYKQDVEDAVIDTADVLALQGRTWRQRADVEADPDTTQRNIGFIAEELDALPTTRQFVVYDEQGRPDSIQYDRITVALLKVAKEQAAQISALTARLDALEARP